MHNFHDILSQHINILFIYSMLSLAFVGLIGKSVRSTLRVELIDGTIYHRTEAAMSWWTCC